MRVRIEVVRRGALVDRAKHGLAQDRRIGGFHRLYPVYGILGRVRGRRSRRERPAHLDLIGQDHDSFALNGVLAIAAIYVAFAIFPARPTAERGPAPPAPAEGWVRTQDAAISTLVMLPPVAILLAFNLTSATRVLLTIAIVLASLNQRDVWQTGTERLVSTLTAGAVALAAAALYAIWPAPGAAMVAMAFLGLLVVPYAFKGRCAARWPWRYRWSGSCLVSHRRAPPPRPWNGASIR